MRKPSNKLPLKKIKPFLNREDAYFLHAIIRIEFDDYFKRHNNNTDIHTLTGLQDLVHEMIKYYTKKEEKK